MMNPLEKIPLETLKVWRDSLAKTEADEDGNLVSTQARNLKSGAQYTIKTNKADYLANFDEIIARRELEEGGAQ